MQVIYLSQDDRFYVRLSEAACERFPAGSFNPGQSQPVYAMRFEAGGEEAPSYFLVPAADGTFYWVSMPEARLARR